MRSGAIMRATYLFVILEAVLVLVRFLAADDRAAERLSLLAGEAKALDKLLLAQAFCQFAIVGKLTRVLETTHTALLAEQTLGRIVDAARLVLLAVHVGEPEARHAGVEVGWINLARRVNGRLGGADGL